METGSQETVSSHPGLLSSPTSCRTSVQSTPACKGLSLLGFWARDTHGAVPLPLSSCPGSHYGSIKTGDTKSMPPVGYIVSHRLPCPPSLRDSLVSPEQRRVEIGKSIYAQLLPQMPGLACSVRLKTIVLPDCPS